jgi:hypothetical protein
VEYKTKIIKTGNKTSAIFADAVIAHIEKLKQFHGQITCTNKELW